MATSKPRLIIIGLDGADWDVIEPFIQQGELPVIESLMDRGSHCVLRSTVPPVTPCAWTTMYTGVNPGKHGVYDFANYLCGQDRIHLTNGSNRRCSTFMQLCSRAGLSVGCLNAPWTYPPDPLDGYVVSGMDTPQFGPGMAHPPEVFDEIVDLVGEYDIKPSPDLGMREKPCVEEIDDRVEKLTTVAMWMMENRPTDLFMLVFLITDSIQHGFLGDRTLRSTSGRVYDDLVLHVYRLVDEAIGKMLEATGDDVPVVLVSDHGGAAFERYVIFDALFRELGFLKLKKESASLTQRVKKAAWSLGYRVKALLPDGWVRRFRKTGARVRDAIKKDFEAPEIDWNSTVAVPMPSFGMIRVNLKGRDPAGIVEPGDEYERTCERITEALEQYRDPLDGARVFAQVRRGRDIYDGPNTKWAPDLVAIPTSTRFHTFSPAGSYQKGLNSLRPPIVPREPNFNGTHSYNGVFVASRGCFEARGRIEQQQIHDIAPTVLAAIGTPIPGYMDGRVIREAFTPEFLAENEPEYDDSAEIEHEDEQIESAYDTEEAEAVEQRLRDLGYM